MAKEREIACQYYTYEGGPCGKRNINANFRGSCQICKKYAPLKGGKPARTDNRKKKKERIFKKEFKGWD